MSSRYDYMFSGEKTNFIARRKKLLMSIFIVMALAGFTMIFFFWVIGAVLLSTGVIATLIVAKK